MSFIFMELGNTRKYFRGDGEQAANSFWVLWSREKRPKEKMMEMFQGARS